MSSFLFISVQRRCEFLNEETLAQAFSDIGILRILSNSLGSTIFASNKHWLDIFIQNLPSIILKFAKDILLNWIGPFPAGAHSWQYFWHIYSPYEKILNCPRILMLTTLFDVKNSHVELDPLIMRAKNICIFFLFPCS